MAKKDDEIIKRLTDIIEGNNKVLEKVLVLLEKLAQPPVLVGPPQEIKDTTQVAESVERAISTMKLFSSRDGDPTLTACPDKLEPAPEPPEAPEEKEKGFKITGERCKKALADVDAGGKYRDTTVDILEKYGAKSLKEVEKRDYLNFYRECRHIISTRGSLLSHGISLEESK